MQNMKIASLVKQRSELCARLHVMKNSHPHCEHDRLDENCAQQRQNLHEAQAQNQRRNAEISILDASHQQALIQVAGLKDIMQCQCQKMEISEQEVASLMKQQIELSARLQVRKQADYKGGTHP